MRLKNVCDFLYKKIFYYIWYIVAKHDSGFSQMKACPIEVSRPGSQLTRALPESLSAEGSLCSVESACLLMPFAALDIAKGAAWH